jgi:hypothetical protein
VELWQLHERDGASPARSARRTLLLRVLAVLGVLGGSVLLGSLVGYQVAEATCDDSEYALLRCFDEDTHGSLMGALAGLVVQVVLVLLLAGTWRR